MFNCIVFVLLCGNQFRTSFRLQFRTFTPEIIADYITWAITSYSAINKQKVHCEINILHAGLCIHIDLVNTY